MKKIFSKSEIRAKLMYKFLKRNRCLKEYVENVIAQKLNLSSTLDYLERKDILKFIEDNRCSIDYSFIWSRTPQGMSYWQKLDHSLDKELRTLLREES